MSDLGSLTEVSAGCQEVRELFSPYLDGDLSTVEQGLLTGHLHQCEECRQEFDLWKNITETLRSEVFAEDPPVDFSAGVMSRLRKEQPEVATFTGRKLLRSWRAPAAAAAAAVLLFAGSWGINVAQKIDPITPGIVATHTETATEITNENPKTKVQPVDGVNDNNPASPVEVQQNNSRNNAAGNSPAPPAPIAGNTGNKASNTVLLSSNQNILSTVLKLSATNPDISKDIALRMASGLGGGGQVYNNRTKSNSELIIIRMTVPRSSGPDLIAQLSGLGGIIDRTDERKDISSEYNAKLNRLNEIQSAIDSGAAASEISQLEAEASALKRNIETWDKELKSYVVILWLEGQ